MKKLIFTLVLLLITYGGYRIVNAKPEIKPIVQPIPTPTPASTPAPVEVPVPIAKPVPVPAPKKTAPIKKRVKVRNPISPSKSHPLKKRGQEEKIPLNLPSPKGEEKIGHFIWSERILYLQPEQTGSVTLSNNGTLAVTDIKMMVPEKITKYFTGACLTTTSLAPGESCTLTYKVPRRTSSSLFANISVSGTGADNPDEFMAVVIAEHGYFVFSKEILNFEPGQKGELTLSNRGSAPITGLNLNFSPEILSYFSGDCLTMTQLGVNDSCVLNYEIPAIPTSGITRKITIAGLSTENSPLEILVFLLLNSLNFEFKAPVKAGIRYELTTAAKSNSRLHCSVTSDTAQACKLNYLSSDPKHLVKITETVYQDNAFAGQCTFSISLVNLSQAVLNSNYGSGQQGCLHR
ncbi:MAG: hypothetical protein WCK49_00410 [Myxococcaceae bacterium]